MVNGTPVTTDQKSAPEQKPASPVTVNGSLVSEIVADQQDLSKDSFFKKPIIKLEGVGKSFKVGNEWVKILKNINLEIFPREFVVILGPSGCGKSTLLNTILGLEKPTSGRVIIRGHDITNYNLDQLAQFRLKKFGVVYQRPDWLRALNVIENVALPLAITDIPKKYRLNRALELLRKLKIDHRAYYNPTELSGGQQQRAVIARALINNPWIVVTDEPTGNLDSESADNVMQIFRSLNEDSKRTLIMVTHNIDYVHYATRTVYMRDGEILNKRINI
ncbi:MAG: ABC transporter ATP-binding protein [Patescibacteria group bacterium]|nr:ABC transporter ATP-binding protein [Patescibacteria group bacterium]MDD5567368.1 ABC transporter ATP-binding protein [Patescibacteria group bacterium]